MAKQNNRKKNISNARKNENTKKKIVELVLVILFIPLSYLRTTDNGPLTNWVIHPISI